MTPEPLNPKRASLQQYWHEGGYTGIMARATLRTIQFSSAIIVIGIYGSELNYRSIRDYTPITNEIYAQVVGILSVITVGFHCFVTVKRAAWVLWDLVLCVLWAALAGVYGSTYLDGSGALAAEDEVKSADGMKAAIAFDLLSMVLWLLTFLQGSIWCCRARRFTRRTDQVDEIDQAESGPVPTRDQEAISLDETLYDESMADEKERKEIKQ